MIKFQDINRFKNLLYKSSKKLLGLLNKEKTKLAVQKENLSKQMFPCDYFLTTYFFFMLQIFL